MANINIDTLKMTDAELSQVKGGPAYMKLGDIKGEATADKGHSKWIELESVSFGR